MRRTLISILCANTLISARKKRHFIVLNRYLVVLVVLLLTLTAQATTYYVNSSTGDDSKSGTSTSTPWKTLAKVNATSFSPGDAILFNRGDSWEGTLTVKNSGTSGNPITYGAYGSGDKPILYGSEVITGWTKYSGNIYKANYYTAISQVFISNKKMKAARFPNSGYANIDAVDNASFTCNALSAEIDYTGAIWGGRTVAYAFDSDDVISSSGNTLTLESVPYSSLGVNEGFLLTNKLEFLDEAGEWYYDAATTTLYLWTPSGDSPENYTVRGTIRDNVVNTNGKDYINIKNLEIDH
jgi:hypothetical protein